MELKDLNIGFAITGSFCTISKVLPQLELLSKCANNVIPIFSPIVCSTDTRFTNAGELISKVEEITQNKVIKTIPEAEPIGPKKIIDALVIAPCTGNTASKIANGITDTSVTMAAKASLRNKIPVVLAIATNDGLSGSAGNIGKLLNTKGIYFVPFGQDDFIKKETSLVADMALIKDTLDSALCGRQIQPLLV